MLRESSSWEYSDALAERGQKEGWLAVPIRAHQSACGLQRYHAALCFSLLRSDGNVYLELLQLPVLFCCMNLAWPLPACP